MICTCDWILLTMYKMMYWCMPQHKCFHLHSQLVWCKRPSFRPISAYDMPSTTSLVISNFWFKVTILPIIWTLGDHCRVIYWPNFNIVVSQEIGRPKERDRDGGMTDQWSIQNTYNTYWLGMKSYVGMLYGAPKQLQ